MPTCIASDPTPSRLVGKRRSVTVKPRISTLETPIAVCGTILVICQASLRQCRKYSKIDREMNEKVEE